MNVIVESIIMVLVGVFLLRLAGRKSISQMSLAQTVIMISIGSIIIQPIIESSLWKTTVAASVFILVLLVMELLQLWFNPVEKFITGKSRIVIQDGVIQTKELQKLRLSVDQIEMFLRQNGIGKLSDVKTATIEPNGQLGYELTEEAKPLTIGELKRLAHPSMLKQPMPTNTTQPAEPPNLFDELRQQKELNSSDSQ
ncbi:DUF421 domain-containing protein [Pontibacillus yanchengensis]|uniref:Membrane protein n=1 Tax=Pontibacillus yanchengensis Y32 TaxID=1385514 RepID=A0A0A2TBI8_9BACI|nr:YetF domain-containing protein [Pontibacillus yanchengensis]KGP71426.1 membrane protein [Pontibacillus yanchengensis Y32]